MPPTKGCVCARILTVCFRHCRWGASARLVRTGRGPDRRLMHRPVLLLTYGTGGCTHRTKERRRIHLWGPPRIWVASSAPRLVAPRPTPRGLRTVTQDHDRASSRYDDTPTAPRPFPVRGTVGCSGSLRQGVTSAPLVRSRSPRASLTSRSTSGPHPVESVWAAVAVAG
jgi:hypothetical protein